MSTTTVSSGQVYIVSAGQVDSGDTVDNGGELDVLSGGTITNTEAGYIQIFGGAASNTIVNSGAEQDVYAIASGTVVNSAGLEVVERI
jgi:autotransporter passenger strand-loop-strand repeat protein